VAQWLILINKLLVERDPQRPIRQTELGNQLFNAAIFCQAHGGASDTARSKAIEFGRRAISLRSAIRPDVWSILPEMADEILAD